MENQLTVIVKAQDLCSFVFTATDTSPKKFRGTIVAKLQHIAMEIIESLYLANDVFVTSKNLKERYPVRRDYQHQALSKIKLLAFFAHLGLKEGAITIKQFEKIAHLTKDCQNLIGGWIKNDKARWHFDQ